jgi:hypothetical protein
MVNPSNRGALSAKRDEDAVAFQEAGNTKLNKNRRTVNGAEQEIEIP